MTKIKYPRTKHLPWSDEVHSDDKSLSLADMEKFQGKRVIVTEKMDGENTTLYRDYFHARSLDGRHHQSRDRLKNFWASIRYNIPTHWRLCYENLYMTRSIKYDNLKSHAYGLSVWNHFNTMLSWDETVEWFEFIGSPQPRVMYDGVYDETKIRNLYDPDRDWDTIEGYVVRLAEEIPYINFGKGVAKYVRKGHIQNKDHPLLGFGFDTNSLGD